MLRTILVGLDGSEYSETAIDLAIRWAKRFDCLVVALGVIDKPKIRGTGQREGSRTKVVFDQLESDARRRVEGMLGSFAIRCADAQISHKLLEDIGYPEEQILRESERYDLIMLGQQTYFHFQTQTRPCHTLERVLRRAARPVVAVPKSLSDGSGVLVAYDGSLQAARTLQAFVASGLHVLGDVHVLNVDESSQLNAAKTTDRAIEFLGSHDVRAYASQIVTYDPPGKVIVREALRHGVDLLVMGACGQPKIKEFLLGSVTHTALETSALPMFLYH